MMATQVQYSVNLIPTLICMYPPHFHAVTVSAFSILNYTPPLIPPTPLLPSAQVDTRVFRHLVRQEFPPVAAHLEGLGADISCVFVQWFLCLFVNFLPDETCLRVWDVVFYQRSSVVLFQVCPYPQTAVSKP